MKESLYRDVAVNRNAPHKGALMEGSGVRPLYGPVLHFLIKVILKVNQIPKAIWDDLVRFSNKMVLLVVIWDEVNQIPIVIWDDLSRFSTKMVLPVVIWDDSTKVKVPPMVATYGDLGRFVTIFDKNEAAFGDLGRFDENEGAADGDSLFDLKLNSCLL